MRAEVVALALMVGAATWAFRYLPLRFDLSGLAPDGWLSRLLAATGPAAIATLFVASVLREAMGHASREDADPTQAARLTAACRQR